jgi:hypothetical protein
LRGLARRWADRAVRIYAAGALQMAGFATSAGALATLPEIADDESVSEAKRRVNTAIETILLAREIPRSEDALVAAYAARAALAVAGHEDPSTRNLKDVVDAIHAASSTAAVSRG